MRTPPNSEVKSETNARQATKWTGTARENDLKRRWCKCQDDQRRRKWTKNGSNLGTAYRMGTKTRCWLAKEAWVSAKLVRKVLKSDIVDRRKKDTTKDEKWERWSRPRRKKEKAVMTTNSDRQGKSTEDASVGRGFHSLWRNEPRWRE